MFCNSSPLLNAAVTGPNTLRMCMFLLLSQCMVAFRICLMFLFDVSGYSLPDTAKGLVVVLENGCDPPFTYQINGESVIPLGHGDLHDTKFDEYMRSATFADVQTINDGTKGRMKVHYDQCTYTIRTYPSDSMVDLYTTSTPVVITTSVAIVFLFAVLMFFVYDRMVERRQRILMEKAKKTHQIVASLFPKNIRDQILNDDGELRQNGVLGAKNTLKSFVNGGMDQHQIFGQMPIADLYPEATVMFADIAGFTSWSSSREPAQGNDESCMHRKLAKPFFIVSFCFFPNFSLCASPNFV